MKRLYLFLTVLFSIMAGVASMASADDLVHPARTNLQIHANTPLTENVGLYGDFIFSSSQYGYLSAGWQMTDQIFLQSGVGLATEANHGILFLMPLVSLGQVCTWVYLEWLPQGENVYLRARSTYQVAAWLKLGIETEGQSDLSGDPNYSWGIGPIADFRFNILGFDLAVYYGNMAGGDPDDFGFGLVGRAHVYF